MSAKSDMKWLNPVAAIIGQLSATPERPQATRRPLRGCELARRPRARRRCRLRFGLVEPARRLLDEDDRHAAREQAADRRVVAARRSRRRRARPRPGRASSSSRSAFGFVKTSKCFFRSRNSRPSQPAVGNLGERERHRIELRRLGHLLRRRACRAGSAAGRSASSRARPRSPRRSARGRRPRRRAATPASRAAATSRAIAGSAASAPGTASLPSARTKSICVSTSQRMRLT